MTSTRRNKFQSVGKLILTNNSTQPCCRGIEHFRQNELSTRAKQSAQVVWRRCVHYVYTTSYMQRCVITYHSHVQRVRGCTTIESTLPTVVSGYTYCVRVCDRRTHRKRWTLSYASKTCTQLLTPMHTQTHTHTQTLTQQSEPIASPCCWVRKNSVNKYEKCVRFSYTTQHGTFSGSFMSWLLLRTRFRYFLSSRSNVEVSVECVMWRGNTFFAFEMVSSCIPRCGPSTQCGTVYIACWKY